MTNRTFGILMLDFGIYLIFDFCNLLFLAKKYTNIIDKILNTSLQGRIGVPPQISIHTYHKSGACSQRNGHWKVDEGKNFRSCIEDT